MCDRAVRGESDWVHLSGCAFNAQLCCRSNNCALWGRAYNCDALKESQSEYIPFITTMIVLNFQRGEVPLMLDMYMTYTDYSCIYTLAALRPARGLE